MHVAEADVLGAGVDLQRGGFLLGRANHDGIAHRDDRLPLVVATGRALLSRARTRPDVLSLVAKTAGALADVEAAVLAEIVAPGIGASNELGLVAAGELLRADRDGQAHQRKADL